MNQLQELRTQVIFHLVELVLASKYSNVFGHTLDTHEQRDVETTADNLLALLEPYLEQREVACETCNGTGLIWSSERQYNNGERDFKCPTCDGTGKLKPTKPKGDNKVMSKETIRRAMTNQSIPKDPSNKVKE